MPKIVTIGGGSGQHGILTGLMNYSRMNPDKLKQENISAVVTTFDTGGHTGELLEARKPRDTQGNYLPAGDIRQCLDAMANNDEVRKLFRYRLKHGANHGTVVGNTLLDAACEMEGDDFEKAIDLLRKFLEVRGNAYPCTTKRARFYGLLKNGRKIGGEDLLAEKAAWFMSPIQKISIEPEDIAANKNAVSEISKADIIVLSQGSLYTSLIPNIAVKEISDAIADSDAKKLYVMNIVTQRGETDGFTAKDHVRTLEDYLGEDILDYIIIHSGGIPREQEVTYEQEGQKRVLDDLAEDSRTIRAELIAHDSPVLRHNPDKLAKVILELY